MQIPSPAFSCIIHTGQKLCEAMSARTSLADIANTLSAAFENTDCNRENIYTKAYAALSAFDHAAMNEICSYITYKREEL